jgi:hypothetical protein
VGLADYPPEVPGQYDGPFTVQSPGGSVYVPVTLLVAPGPAVPVTLSVGQNASQPGVTIAVK